MIKQLNTILMFPWHLNIVNYSDVPRLQNMSGAHILKSCKKIK